MDEKIRCGYLYDFYGELLNDHQKSIMEDYFYNDLSLSEIASSNGISRQGVHDLIKRCTKSLEDYEAKLHLLERFLSLRDKINHINDLAKESDSSDVNKQIITISNEILEEL